MAYNVRRYPRPPGMALAAKASRPVKERMRLPATPGGGQRGQSRSSRTRPMRSRSDETRCGVRLMVPVAA